MHPYLIILGEHFLNYRKELRLYNHKQGYMQITT